MSFARVMLRSFATVALATGLALTSQLATAANDGLPDGSWSQSCQNGKVRNGILYAQCRRDNGRYKATSESIGSCLAFGSRDGELFCERPGTTDDAASGWGGSFRETCSDISVDKQGKLKARCRKDNGTYQSTNLSMWKCLNRQVSNRDGRLVCDKSGSGSGSAKNWDGSFRQSCRDISADSRGTLTATCQAANGSWHRSSLSTGQCSDRRAGNSDGTLVCESSDGGAVGANQWQGSFRQSCRDISADSAGTLTATCQAANGSWHRSSLSRNQCNSYRADNRNGTLVCESADGGNMGANQWQGSFRNSCRDISADSAGTLTATCQAANGSWHRSSLAIRQCSDRRAGNRDGTLVCESSDGGNANQWQGSFRQSCRDISADSAGTLTATCQAMNGSWHRSSLSTAQCNSRRAGNRDSTLVCESQDGSNVGANRWQGSFRNSCRDITADSAGTLTATCQAANGSWHRSSLSTRQCSDRRAGNRDGTLVCESQDGSNVGANQWQGSFRQSCRDISADSAGTLIATCQAMNGSWHRSSLSTAQCNSRRAGNRDGNLFCEG